MYMYRDIKLLISSCNISIILSPTPTASKMAVLWESACPERQRNEKKNNREATETFRAWRKTEQRQSELYEIWMSQQVGGAFCSVCNGEYLMSWGCSVSIAPYANNQIMSRQQSPSSREPSALRGTRHLVHQWLRAEVPSPASKQESSAELLKAMI